MTSRPEHELLLQEAVGYFKSRQGLHRLLLQIKKKYQSPVDTLDSECHYLGILFPLNSSFSRLNPKIQVNIC